MRTNLTYQPQPAICYISKTTALEVTTGWLLVNNIQFYITVLGVMTGQLPTGNIRFKITTPGVVTGTL